MLPAAFHENIIGTFVLAINQILGAGHHWWGHRNQREEPSRYYTFGGKKAGDKHVVKMLGARNPLVTRI